MSAYLSLIGRRRGGRLFEAGRLTFSAFRMGAYSNKYDIYFWSIVQIVLALESTHQGLVFQSGKIMLLSFQP